jgi:succinate dehydrogenase/fumarate reductase flavoprotein subunit
MTNYGSDPIYNSFLSFIDGSEPRRQKKAAKRANNKRYYAKNSEKMKQKKEKIYELVEDFSQGKNLFHP